MSLQIYKTKDSQDICIQGFRNVWAPYSAPFLIDTLIDHQLNDAKNKKVLDICSGSGILGIWYALNGAQSITFTDASSEAVEASIFNYKLNRLTGQPVGVVSDRFLALDRQPFDVIIANPPVQPWLKTLSSSRSTRTTSAAWNEAGHDGRLVLDALLKNSLKYLSADGYLIFTHSSRHGDSATIKMLNQYWGKENIFWKTIAVELHQIDESYHQPYIPLWRELEEYDNQKRLFNATEAMEFYAKNPSTSIQHIGKLFDGGKLYYTYNITVASARPLRRAP